MVKILWRGNFSKSVEDHWKIGGNLFDGWTKCYQLNINSINVGSISDGSISDH